MKSPPGIKVQKKRIYMYRAAFLFLPASPRLSSGRSVADSDLKTNKNETNTKRNSKDLAQ